MFKTAAKYDARLSDEREVLVAHLRDDAYEGDHRRVEVRFENVTAEVARERKISDFEASAGCWVLSEIVDDREAELSHLDFGDNSFADLCETLIDGGYGSRYYRAAEDGARRRVPAWAPQHREPDEELLERHHDYVRMRIHEMFDRDEMSEGYRRTLAERYDVDLPEEVDA